MAGVAAVLLHEVEDQAAQVEGSVSDGDRPLEPTVGELGRGARAVAADGAVVERVELVRAVPRGRGELPLRVVSSMSMLAQGSPSGSPDILAVDWWSSMSARCLRSPPSVSVELGIVALSPALSRPSAFQRNVARSRSRAPVIASTSVPDLGGSQGGPVVSVIHSP